MSHPPSTNMITRQIAADKLMAYLRHEMSADQLVDWAENAMLEADFAAGEADLLRPVVSRLGLADVRAFDLSWQDCEALLDQLGYKVRLEILPA